MNLPWAYFDTSTYLKLYIKEDASDEARRLSAKNRILSSAILLTECFSALSRKRGEGEITDKEIERLVNHIREDLSCIEIVKLADDVIKMAEEIALKSTVRALDAIHIASALLFQEAVNINLVFVTSDMKQEKAATHQGLKTLFVG